MASTSKVSEIRSLDNTIKTTIQQETKKLRPAAVEAIKAEYHDKLRTKTLSTERRDFDTTKLWSKFFLNELIDDIKKEKHFTRFFRTNYINKYKDKLEIGTSSNGNEHLLVKDKGLFKIFPAWQEIFDIIWPLHLEHNHPKPEVIVEILNDYYIIQNFAVEFLNDVCPVCLGEGPFLRCAVYILEMVPDNTFDQIMVYEELSTGFIHMAPMNSNTAVLEMSLELLRLFMDYGPPKKLFITDKIVEKSIAQVKKLTRFTPFYLDTIHFRLDTTYMNRLKDLISDWSTENSSSSWGIACFVLKWQLNNKIDEYTKQSPSDCIFRSLDGNNAVEVEKLDRINVPSASAIREEVILSPGLGNPEHSEAILPIIDIDSVTSLAPTVDVNEAPCPISSDDDMDEPEVFLEADEDLIEPDVEDPLATN